MRVDGEVDGVRCLGLNKVGWPGHLVAFEIQGGGRPWAVIAEWPPAGR